MCRNRLGNSPGYSPLSGDMALLSPRTPGDIGPLMGLESRSRWSGVYSVPTRPLPPTTGDFESKDFRQRDPSRDE